MIERPREGWRRWILLLAALVLLDASLTFVNVWPTPAVTWRGSLSVELAAFLLLLAAASTVVALSHRIAGLVAALWVLLVIGRYAEVTAPALFGRPINLYWDGRHLSDVVAMLANPASWWMVLLAIAALVLVPLLIFLPLRWALRLVVGATRLPGGRWLLGSVAGVMLTLFIVAPRTDDPPAVQGFATPVTATYGRQFRLLANELTRAGTIAVPASPPLTSDLSRLDGADVIIVFIESYGAVSYDNPAFATALAPARRRLSEDVRESGRQVVSAFVTSPTFGGSSWLAHISLLSGIQVRDEDTNDVLMTRSRDTLVTTFARHGYRTVAVMPGLQQRWPEGAFYGFDDIYGEQRLDYRGPQFGWWSVPDQFTLARLSERELAPDRRRPLFAVFPTISTHTPFSPTAPYQADWNRMLTDHPYDDADVALAFDREPDWLDLAPGYVYALKYDLATIGGFLRLPRQRDLVMVLIGDHQPPAAVSGEGSRWDVPVHIISSRGDLLDRFTARGFVSGLQPPTAPIGEMNAMASMLLQVFGR